MPEKDDVEIMGSINPPPLLRRKRFSLSRVPKWVWFVVLVFAVAIGFQVYHKKTTSVPNAASVLPAPPLPDPKASVSDNPEYRRKIDILNQQALTQAEKSGQSAVPAAGGGGPTGFPKKEATSAPPPSPTASSAEISDLRKKLAEEDRKAIEASRERERTAVGKEFDGILATWSSQGDSLAVLVASKKAAPSLAASRGTPGKSSGKAGSGKSAGKGIPIIPAGKILYGRIVNELNSDRPGPVLAQAVGGKFDGVKFLGTFQRDRGALVIKFDRVIYPDGETDSIGAYAVSPGAKLRSGLETDVNNHYLYRYGALLASAFMQGFGQSAMYANSTSYPSAMGTPVIGFNGMTLMQQTEMGLGQAGMMLGGQAMNAFNTPPTVKVAANTPVGLMIVAETGQKLPKSSTSTAGTAPAKPGLVNAPVPSMVPQPGYPQPMMGGGYPGYPGYGGGYGMPMMPMMP